MPTRRDALRSVGAACAGALTSGCLFGISSSPGHGTLELETERDETQTVTLLVETVSREQISGGPANVPTPESTPIARREDRFEVGPGQEITREGYLQSPGTYHVVGRLDTGETSRGWIEVDGEYLDVVVRSEGFLFLAGQQVGV